MDINERSKFKHLTAFFLVEELCVVFLDELENKYNAKVNAQLVREAAELYEKRDRLRKD